MLQSQDSEVSEQEVPPSAMPSQQGLSAQPDIDYRMVC